MISTEYKHKILRQRLLFVVVLVVLFGVILYPAKYKRSDWFLSRLIDFSGVDFNIKESQTSPSTIVFTDSNKSTNPTTYNNVAGKKVVDLLIGSKKGYYEVGEAQTSEIKVKKATIKTFDKNREDQKPVAEIEEYTLTLCRIGEGKVPYYLTFADLSGKTPVLDLPVHLVGDPFGLLRFKCNGDHDVCAVYVPNFWYTQTSPEGYLKKLGEINSKGEDEYNVRALNVPNVGALTAGGALSQAGGGDRFTPTDDFTEELEKKNPLLTDREAQNIQNYLFVFSLYGLKQSKSYVQGTFKTPDNTIDNFATKGTQVSDVIYLKYPASITGLARDLVYLANQVAYKGAFNETIRNIGAYRSPQEVKVKESSDCIGCNIYSDSEKSEDQNMQEVYKLMALTPYVINIEGQHVPKYLTDEDQNMQNSAPLGLTMANVPGETTIQTGTPPKGSYLFAGVDTQCQGLASVPDFLQKCTLMDLLPDKVLELFEQGASEDQDKKEYCSVDGVADPKRLLGLLKDGRLGATQKIVVNLGVPVLSSLTLDSPNGLVFQQGISHSVLDSISANQLRIPNQANQLNYVETFYVLGKLRLVGVSENDLIKEGLFDNLIRLASGGQKTASLEQIREKATELKQDLEMSRYSTSPVVITTRVSVKLYPRVDEKSEMGPYFNKPLGPYPIRVYSFLGHNLSWLFRSTMFSSGPIPSDCASGPLSPTLKIYLSTLKQAYGYEYGQIVLKASKEEDTKKLRLELEYESTPPFSVPDKLYSLDKDEEYLQKCIPNVVELFKTGLKQ